MSELEVITRCNDCIFRASLNDIQDGCKVGRLQQFKSIGTDTEWDNTTNSFIIKRVCNMKRLEKWAENKVDIVKSVLAETILKVDFILIVPNHIKYQAVAAYTCKTLKQCINQTIKPSSVIIVTSNEDVDKNLKMFWQDVIVDTMKDSGVKYQMVREVGASRPLNSMIDDAVKKCKGQYYAAVESGDKIEPDVIERMNDMINNQLKRIIYIQPTNLTAGYPTVIQVVAHRMLSGNGLTNILLKIDEYIDANNQTEFRATWEPKNVVISR